MTGLEPATTGITKQLDAHDGVISDQHTRRSETVSAGPGRLSEAACGASVGQLCPTLAPHRDAPEQRCGTSAQGPVTAPDGSAEGSRGVSGGNEEFVMPTPPARHRRTGTQAPWPNAGAVVHGKVVRHDDVPSTAAAGAVESDRWARLDVPTSRKRLRARRRFRASPSSSMTSLGGPTRRSRVTTLTGFAGVDTSPPGDESRGRSCPCAWTRRSWSL